MKRIKASGVPFTPSGVSPLDRIAQLTEENRKLREANNNANELLSAILLWLEADMRKTPLPYVSMAAHFLPTFCKNTRKHLSSNEG